ncbi:MAG: hypothetical protein HN932_12865 [Candidatus Marinimicrobia bacterium]|jgi:hypothetical protein|nr:hypothetical protein [Candidatus Neomarinimicrobiota bacterium]MBT7339106.1 hypothetical protein [Candidatus Jacksonbacteria bacterium]
MIIALDYDETMTKDPAMWRQFCTLAQGRGHDVILVTMRYKHREPVNTALASWCNRVIYTGRQAKAPYLLEHYKIMPDIWIDDFPFGVNNDAPEMPAAKQKELTIEINEGDIDE